MFFSGFIIGYYFNEIFFNNKIKKDDSNRFRNGNKPRYHY
mgnify:CR=1 FL=1